MFSHPRVYYYVYRLTRRDGTAFYIGSRKSRRPPSEDFGQRYFSSGPWEKEFRATPNAFVWEILSEHTTDPEARDEETRQIGLVWDDPACVNRHQFPNRFRYDEAWRRKVVEKNRKRAQDPEWRRKNAEANRKLAQDPEWRRKTAEANRKLAQDPDWREKRRQSALQQWARVRATRAAATESVDLFGKD